MDAAVWRTAIAGLPAAPDLSDLAAVRPGSEGAVPIRPIQTGERLSERPVEGLIAGAQALALAGRFGQPAVSFAPTPESGDGIALAVAPAADLARSLDIASLGPVTGPRLALLPGMAGRRPVVVVTGAGEADVTAALAQLGELAALPPQGSPEGLAVLRDVGGRRITGGESLTLADLGLTDAAIGGRTHQLTLDLALPHDLLAADYAKIALDLDATYPAGLAPGAQVSVSINGEAAGSVPLGKAGGESLRRRTVCLPLRPGLNRITLLAELPRADDRACAAPAGARLTLRASTRLTIPDLARIARQPDLAATAAAGFPYRAGAEGRAPTLSVPAPNRDTMAAAATLATRLGLAAGRPIPFAFAAGRSDVVGPTVVVAALRSPDAPLLKAAGLEPQALRDAWTRRAGRPPGAGGEPGRPPPAPRLALGARPAPRRRRHERRRRRRPPGRLGAGRGGGAVERPLAPGRRPGHCDRARAQADPAAGRPRAAAAARRGGVRRRGPRRRPGGQPVLLGLPGLRPDAAPRPEIRRDGLDRSGRRLIRAARFGSARLPSEWVSLAEAAPRPADGFAPDFAYNACASRSTSPWRGRPIPSSTRHS
ncbi:hypothetical protein MPEAHAMD_1310 [Methylobacterium frigidaeris]|uniref:Cyclic di-GMP-binding protein n=1 Tax=Methylobacterium frigidaeris TaxID=2038277 RepID=A0AA37H9C1_9HYPH|nr:cellulose biosynthesis cyclic di-GMP-binding regulatory protein BcsB [Methylobacterium frigidaeris]GJD61170.1 hypothetical protein MPEAHAMD_1310 [Methylobacterium frigidaeris]